MKQIQYSCRVKQGWNFLWKNIGIMALKFSDLHLNCTFRPPNCTLGPQNLGVRGPRFPGPPGSASTTYFSAEIVLCGVLKFCKMQMFREYLGNAEYMNDSSKIINGMVCKNEKYSMTTHNTGRASIPSVVFYGINQFWFEFTMVVYEN